MPSKSLLLCSLRLCIGPLPASRSSCLASSLTLAFSARCIASSIFLSSHSSSLSVGSGEAAITRRVIFLATPSSMARFLRPFASFPPRSLSHFHRASFSASSDVPPKQDQLLIIRQITHIKHPLTYHLISLQLALGLPPMVQLATIDLGPSKDLGKLFGWHLASETAVNSCMILPIFQHNSPFLLLLSRVLPFSCMSSYILPCC